MFKCAEMLSKMVGQGIRRAGRTGVIPEWNTRKTGGGTKRAGMTNWVTRTREKKLKAHTVGAGMRARAERVKGPTWRVEGPAGSA